MEEEESGYINTLRPTTPAPNQRGAVLNQMPDIETK